MTNWRLNKQGGFSRIQPKVKRPEVQRAYRQRQRAPIGSGHFTGAELIAQGEQQGWRCYWCGVDCRTQYHIDHIVPLAKGGDNRATNICIACPACNLSKGSKSVEEWKG